MKKDFKLLLIPALMITDFIGISYITSMLSAKSDALVLSGLVLISALTFINYKIIKYTL